MGTPTQAVPTMLGSWMRTRESTAPASGSVTVASFIRLLRSMVLWLCGCFAMLLSFPFWPFGLVDRISGEDQASALLLELGEALVGGVSEIDDAGDDHRGSAIREETHPADDIGGPLEVVEELPESPVHAVTLGLAGNVDEVVAPNDVEILGVERPDERLIVNRNVGFEDPKVLGLGQCALDQHLRIALASSTVPEDGLLQATDDSVAGRTEKAVVRPDHERVPALLGELRWIGHGPTHFVDGRPNTIADILLGDDSTGSRMIAVAIHPPVGEEDGHRLMRVERVADLGDLVGVAIDEVGNPLTVTDGSGDRERGLARVEAEVVLRIDEQEHDLLVLVGAGGLDARFKSGIHELHGPRGVDVPHLAGIVELGSPRGKVRACAWHCCSPLRTYARLCYLRIVSCKTRSCFTTRSEPPIIVRLSLPSTKFLVESSSAVCREPTFSLRRPSSVA